MLPPPLPTSTISTTGQHHRMAGNITADVVAAGNFRVKIFDQTRFRRRAAHVEGNDMPAIERFTQMRRGDYARHGPDSIIVTGIFFAVSADITPPLIA